MKSFPAYSLLIASLSAATLIATAAAQVSVTPSLATTATQGITVSQLVGATDLGPTPASQPLTVRLGLKLQNQTALQSYVRSITDPSSPLYGQSLTPAEFAAKYAPSSAQVNQVVSFLQSAGFSNVTVEPNNLLISADGTTALASAAFHTSFEQFGQFGNIVFGNTTAPQLPASIAPLVAGILGLNSIGMMKPTIALPSSLPQYAVSYTPTQLQHIYGADGVKAASNATIAIMAEGDVSGVITDLRTAEKAFGLPEVPISIVQVGIPSTDVSGADEWDLDTQYSSGMAGNLKHLYLYATTSLSDSDLALEFNHWATDDKAKAASASLGECEIFPYLDGSMVIDDEIFLEAAAQGQTFFASAGDTGSFCPAGPAGANGVPAGAPLVNYPAASPYVVGVGGTTLLTNQDGNYNTEVSWYAGSGGLSQFEATPFWQAAAVSTLSTTGDRSVPDIAFDADPESGATVYVNGSPEGVGGTSLSSPMALGTWARAISINPKLGFGSPRIYGLYDGTGLLGAYPVGGFHDVTVGTNGLYPAGPGYDLDTGLGTPIVNQFTSALSK